MEKDTSTLEDKVTSPSLTGQTEEPEWLILKQQQVNREGINTSSDITESLFSTGKTPSTVASNAPLIVDLNENPDNGDTVDVTKGNALAELMLPLEITPSSSSSLVGRRPLIEEIDDSVSSNTSLLTHSSSNKGEGSATNFFITDLESSIFKATSFSTVSKEPVSTSSEFGGQWAEHIPGL